MFQLLASGVLALRHLQFRLGGMKHGTFCHTQYGTIHYWEGGRGPPLVMVHGLGGSVLQDFRNAAIQLSDSFRVFALDLPGYGYAYTNRMQQTIHGHADVLKAFVEHHQLKCFHLLGNSMGGWVTLMFALRYPQRVHRLVLTASAGIRFDPPRLELFLPHDPEGMIQLFKHLFNREPHLSGFAIRILLALSKRSHPAVREMINRMLTGEDLLDDRLKELNQPTLILWGEMDRIIPVDTGRRLAQLIPGSQMIVFPKAGHLIFHERSGETVSRIEDFLLTNPVKSGNRSEKT